MSSLDIYAITKELQGLVGYRVDNIYRDITDTFYLFKFKGKGHLKNPFLLIEPGIRIHLTEMQHSVSKPPSDKILAMRQHLKGTDLLSIQQIDFDRLVVLTLKGKQEYRIYIEIFGNRPNFIVVGDQNRVILATWYRKMRHRDVLPGKEFEFPPSRGKSILDISYEEIQQIIEENNSEDEQIVRMLAKKTGGGGPLMEEILARSDIIKTTKTQEISDKEVNQIFNSIKEIKKDLENPKPTLIVDSDDTPLSFQPIEFKSITGISKKYNNFSSAVDSYYSNITPKRSVDLKQHDREKKKLLKVLDSQKKAIIDFETKKKKYKDLGDKIFLHLNEIEELLTTIVAARRNNISWSEIQIKLVQAKNEGRPSARIFDKIIPDRGLIHLTLETESIEVDFRKSATEIANEYYERAKKATRKILPAKEAILETEKRISVLEKDISEQQFAESFTLKRRKRKWYEKYHWTKTVNGFLIIGGKDIRSNEEIAKRRMKKDDLFFHAELRGAPYTILIRDSSSENVTDSDIASAGLLAAAFSSGWKAGYGAVDVYHVPAESASFTAPSGEYIPKGGIMVRGTRNYLRGVKMALAIGVKIGESNALVIYGSEEDVESESPISIIIKPGAVSKGKIAKQIQKILIEKTENLEDKAKIRGIDFNDLVRAIPHDSVITEVRYSDLGEKRD
ncbi:MAG: NFACT family protein [Candidatus Heimdallarchaeota archaeon]|nr:MAG: NFACT family protein [Candidatus Heimdallarchaeota archaeon]